MHFYLDFETLAHEEGVEKGCTRLQLLVSTACKSPDSKEEDLIFKIKTKMFEVIEDNGHESCGFIPDKL